jgi:hypothetical protein
LTAAGARKIYLHGRAISLVNRINSPFSGLDLADRTIDTADNAIVMPHNAIDTPSNAIVMAVNVIYTRVSDDYTRVNDAASRVSDVAWRVNVIDIHRSVTYMRVSDVYRLNSNVVAAIKRFAASHNEPNSFSDNGVVAAYDVSVYSPNSLRSKRSFAAAQSFAASSRNCLPPFIVVT